MIKAALSQLGSSVTVDSETRKPSNPQLFLWDTELAQKLLIDTSESILTKEKK